MPQTSAEEVIAEMKTIREQQGEASFVAARDSLVKMLISAPRGEDFLKIVFPDLDLEPYRGQAKSVDAQMMEMLRTKVPSLKTQFQLELVVTGADTFMVAMDKLFSGEKKEAELAIQGLMQILDAAEKYHAVSEQVSEIPPEERSPTASKLVDPPVREQEVFASLMADLGLIATKEGLDEWYKANRLSLDKVASQSLRNELFDAIRNLKNSLSN